MPAQAKPALTIQRVEGGFPHSEILGSKLVRSSPRLFAAYHVLHRLSAPRHPPDALTTLDYSHDRCPLGSGHRPQERPVFALLQRHVLLAKAYPALLAAGQGWFAELGCPLAEYAASLRFQTSAPPPKGRARISLTSEPVGKWWSLSGSNRRPEACKATALPAELRPRARRQRDNGGPGTTRTSDLTLIRGAL